MTCQFVILIVRMEEKQAYQLLAKEFEEKSVIVEVEISKLTRHNYRPLIQER